jgi:hypothetical protein
MNREEQIKQAEVKYSDDTLFDGCDYIGQVAKQEAFIAAAKWADKTMIDKACRWLDQQLFIKYDSDAVAKFINDFRKAMEE